MPALSSITLILTLVTASGLNINSLLFGYLMRRSPDSNTAFTMPVLPSSWGEKMKITYTVKLRS